MNSRVIHMYPDLGLSEDPFVRHQVDLQAHSYRMRLIDDGMSNTNVS